MIIVRAPLRISFVGGGTDLRSFYQYYPGRVVSATINKYVCIVLNEAEFLRKFIVKYQDIEAVTHPRELAHDRFREALLHLNLVERGLEIASFADIPAKTGLGSSSTFSVALMKALVAYQGRTMSKEEAAKIAVHLEINILGEPIGKQDQYAAAYGGMNLFQFNADESVNVEPLFVDFRIKAALEQHMILYFTGISRAASSVLAEQAQTISDKMEIYKAMSDSALEFKEKLLSGDIRGMAEMLHSAWLRKKSLASGVSNSSIDALYQSGLDAGAWGGKILGAGGGGCLLFLAPPDVHTDIHTALIEASSELGLLGARSVPIQFSQSGVDVLFNSKQ